MALKGGMDCDGFSGPPWSLFFPFQGFYDTDELAAADTVLIDFLPI